MGLFWIMAGKVLQNSKLGSNLGFQKWVYFGLLLGKCNKNQNKSILRITIFFLWNMLEWAIELQLAEILLLHNNIFSEEKDSFTNFNDILDYNTHLI